MAIIGSLGHAFASRILTVEIRVKPPFTLVFYARFLTGLR